MELEMAGLVARLKFADLEGVSFSLCGMGKKEIDT